MDGEVSLYAGTGVYGFENGPALQATFTNPNGICFSHTGDTLYVRETLQANNRIRIIYDLTTAVKDNQENENGQSAIFEIYPNPVIEYATIQINILKESVVDISVYDLYGEFREIVVATDLNPGNHKFKWKTENLPSGIYFCWAKIGKRSINKKVIVQ